MERIPEILGENLQVFLTSHTRARSHIAGISTWRSRESLGRKFSPNMSNTYHAMQQQFCHKGSFSDLPSLKQLRTCMSKLSGIQPVKYHCCKNSCMCFAGPFANLDKCLECNAPRTHGVSGKSFEYMPLIPQLHALFCCPETHKLMEYWHTYKLNNSIIQDIFDGELYCTLRKRFVMIDGKCKPFKFFKDE
jgi:hypothetical protein